MGSCATSTGYAWVTGAMGSVSHVLYWNSENSKRTVRSLWAPKIVASGEAINKINILAFTSSRVLGTVISFRNAPYYKDFYTSLSSKREFVDKSLRPYVNCIYFELEPGPVARIICILGKLNQSDSRKKKTSPMATPIHLAMIHGRLAHSFEAAEPFVAGHPLDNTNLQTGSV